MVIPRSWTLAAVGLAVMALAATATQLMAPVHGHAHAGGIRGPRRRRLAGRAALGSSSSTATRCRAAQRPTVEDSQLDDYGAAYPGFLIMNPRLLDKVSTPVKMWIYAHECGHQFRGPDEETADCFAVQRGRRQGWLKPEGLEEVCKFISPGQGRQHAFLRLAPLRIHAQVLRRPGIR